MNIQKLQERGQVLKNELTEIQRLSIDHQRVTKDVAALFYQVMRGIASKPIKLGLTVEENEKKRLVALLRNEGLSEVAIRGVLNAGVSYSGSGYQVYLCRGGIGYRRYNHKKTRVREPGVLAVWNMALNDELLEKIEECCSEEYVEKLKLFREFFTGYPVGTFFVKFLDRVKELDLGECLADYKFAKDLRGGISTEEKVEFEKGITFYTTESGRFLTKPLTLKAVYLEISRGRIYVYREAENGNITNLFESYGSGEVIPLTLAGMMILQPMYGTLRKMVKKQLRSVEKENKDIGKRLSNLKEGLSQWLVLEEL